MTTKKSIIRRMMLDEMKLDGWMDDPEKLAKVQHYCKLLLVDEDGKKSKVPAQPIRAIFLDGSIKEFLTIGDTVQELHVTRETILKCAYDKRAIKSGQNKGLRFEFV